MWFGTGDGLNKYDGYRFTLYKHDPDNPNSLGSNDVLAIYEDRSGTLWIGTRGGLNKLVPSTKEGSPLAFIHFKTNPNDTNSLSNNYVTSICEDRSGRLWIGTRDGLNKLVPSDRGGSSPIFSHWINEPGNPNSLSNNYVTSICEDRSGGLWIGTRDGLNKLVLSTKEGSPLAFIHFETNPNDTNSLSHNFVTSICADQSGGFWIGTDGGGLNRFFPNSKDGSPPIFKHWVNDPGNPNSLSHNHVRSIYKDKAGVLWIGTWGSGLNQLVPSINEESPPIFKHWVNDPLNPQSLSDNSIYSIFEDRSGVLWIGTVGELNKYDREQNKFKHWANEPGNPNSLSHNYVYSICEANSGKLWIGTEGGGLNRFDREKGTFIHIVNEPGNTSSLSNNYIYSIYEDKSGILWVGTREGLNRLISSADEGSPPAFLHWVHEPDNPNSLSNNIILSIYEDQAGILWVGTRGGLNKLIPGVKEGSPPTFTHWINEPANPNSLSNNAVISIFEDRSRVLWIGTNGGGLNQLIPGTREGSPPIFKNYVNEPGNPNSLSNNEILSIYEDRSDVLWIGTMGGGLNKLVPSADEGSPPTFIRYKEKDGLSNDVVYGILEDNQGNLWLSTNKGLSKFNPQTETFIKYDALDGLNINEFNQGAYHKNNDKLFFGGMKGFVSFSPGDLRDNPHIPPIVITAFKKFDKTVKTDIFATEEIKLSYKDKYFSFEFAALDYRNPEKNQYTHMMEGFDEDWIHSGTRRFARYTSLNPGKYIFRVKGTNNDGVWNEKGVTIKITITPPFWQTLWFRILAGASLLGIGFLVHKRRVRNIEAQRNKLEIQVGERTKEIAKKNIQLESSFQELKDTQSQLVQSEKMASLGNLAAGVAHEINSPVGAVASAADTSQRSIDKIIKILEGGRELKEIKEDEKFQEVLNILKGNNDVIVMASERIAKIAQSLRSFARLEEADFQEADIHEGLESTLTLLHHELKDRIKIVKEYGDIPKIHCYPNQLNQVFMNILVNASHAIKDKGTITIKTAKKDGNVIVSISDDGEGIKEDNLGKIFDPGFTTRGVGVGTGLGLSISYNIIKDHKGELKAKSEVGKGSEFIISLPIKQKEASE